MTINYIAVLACGVIAMILGGIWYGPLFGKVWLKVTGASHHDLEQRKKMERESRHLYVIQFFLVLMQVLILTDMTAGFGRAGIVNSIITWFGFVMPTLWGASMWTNDSRRVAWTRFMIQAGYQLVVFIIFGIILGYLG